MSHYLKKEKKNTAESKRKKTLRIKANSKLQKTGQLRNS